MVWLENLLQQFSLLWCMHVLLRHGLVVLPPQKGLEFPGGVGGSVRPKNLKKCMKLNWNFQRGGGVFKKLHSVGEVWIFSGITQ